MPTIPPVVVLLAVLLAMVLGIALCAVVVVYLLLRAPAGTTRLSGVLTPRVATVREPPEEEAARYAQQQFSDATRARLIGHLQESGLSKKEAEAHADELLRASEAIDVSLLS